MKFWDSSAIVPLLINEATTATLRALAMQDTDQTVWWATSTECISALALRLRLQHIEQRDFDAGISRLADIRARWTEVSPTAALRTDAERLLTTYALRAADALQLAAALDAAQGRSSPLSFISLDRRLCEAARDERFVVEP